MTDSSNLDSVIRAVSAADASNNYDEAVDILRRAIDATPDSITLLRKLAAVLREMRRFSESLGYSRQAAALAPDDPAVLLELGHALRLDSWLPEALEVHHQVLDMHPSRAARAAVANDLVQLGRPDQALPFTDEAAQSDQAGREILLMRTRALNGLGRYREALQLARELTDAQPDFFPAWIATAEALMGLGHSWSAAAQKAIEIEPDIEISLLWKARIAIHDGHEREAIPLLETAVRLHPRYYHALAQLGITYRNAQHIDDAARAFEQAIQIAPWNDYVVGARAMFQVNTQRGTPDFTALEQRAHAQPYGGLASYLARIYKFEIKDNTRSLPMFQLSVEHCPDSSELHRLYAAALLQAGRQDEALAEYRSAAALNPRYGDAWLGIGMTLRGLRCSEEALIALRKAVELMPTNPVAFHGLGLALLEVGRNTEAVIELQHAVQFGPDVGIYHHGLAFALYQAGRLADARRVAHNARALLPIEHPGHQQLDQILS